MDEPKRDVMDPWSPDWETHRHRFPKDGNIYNQPMDSEKAIKHQQDQYKEDIRHLREENVSPEGETNAP
jgi:hypothetical protein